MGVSFRPDDLSGIAVDLQLSQRTLQRRARAAGRGRFAWSDARDQVLRDNWLSSDPKMLAGLIGCSIRSLYLRAGALQLQPRDPVKRAMKTGAMPRAPLSLPTFDELRARAQLESTL